MDDPLEIALGKMLTEAGIGFTRPERDAEEPTNLDFFLPAIGMYIEVKQFHTPRIADQLAKVPPQRTALVLIGPRSAKDFARLVLALATSHSQEPR